MDLLTLLAAFALAHVRMPVDLYGEAGVQYRWDCDSPEAGPRTGTLTGSALRTDYKVCYLDHDGRETITASFTDGGGTVACAPVTLNMSPYPGNHYRSPCRAVFRFDQLARTCDAQCVTMPWVNASFTRPMAFPNPVRTAYNDSMQFINLSPGSRLRIYSLTGRLVYESTVEGDGSFHWHLEDSGGRRVGSGVYLVISETASGVQKLKVAVQR